MSHLNGKQVSFLRALAHHLNPVVQVGKAGITEAVRRQIDEQLRAHELIKVRFAQEAPIDAKSAAATIAETSDGVVVQIAGRTLSLYRRHDHRPKIELPGMRIRRAADAGDRKRDPRLSLRRRHSKVRRQADEVTATKASGGARRAEGIDRLRTPTKNRS